VRGERNVAMRLKPVFCGNIFVLIVSIIVFFPLGLIYYFSHLELHESAFLK
jgi:hypothetical protein